MKRIDPENAKGTQDLLITQARLKKQLIDIISQVADHHGFDYIETPILENIETLKTAESDFRIFNALTGEDDAWDTGLRFDLTVPLARVVAQNWNELPKPFKRYQFGEVFRGEKPQKGRFRQFTQFDLDIVGTKNIDADTSLLLLGCDVFDRIQLGSIATMHINSKQYFNALQEELEFNDNQIAELVKLFDKSLKISKEEFKSELEGISNDVEAQEVCIAISQITPSQEFDTMLSYIKESSHYFELALEFTKIKETMEFYKGQCKWVFNPLIARGFGYYTDMVCEIMLEGYSFSALGGGRYDKLTERFSTQNFPAVGISFGIDRILLVLSEKNIKLPSFISQKIVVGYLDDAVRSYAYRVLTDVSHFLPNASIEMYQADDIDPRGILMYSLSKGATHMIILGTDEMSNETVTVKNLETKEQSTIPRDVLENYFKQ